MKLRFDLNRFLTAKADDQQGAWPVQTELNEQELAFVTGGLGHNDSREDPNRRYYEHRRRREHDYNY